MPAREPCAYPPLSLPLCTLRLHTRAELLGILALCLILELSPEGVGNPESDVATIRDIVDEHVVVWGGEGSLVAGGDEVVSAEG